MNTAHQTYNIVQSISTDEVERVAKMDVQERCKEGAFHGAT